MNHRFIYNYSKEVKIIFVCTSLFITVSYYLKNNRIYFYFGLTSSVGLLFGLFISRGDLEITYSKLLARLSGVIGYILILIMVIDYVYSPVRISNKFYYLILITTAVITIGIYYYPGYEKILQILIFGTIIRLAYWTAAPVIGRDVRVHVAWTRYVVEQGRIIPNYISYYSFYPFGHTMGAITSIITQTSIKPGIFLSIGLSSLLGLLVVAIITRKLIDIEKGPSLQIMLFAMLYLSISPYHIRFSSAILPQSLMYIFIPLAMLPFIYNDSRILILGFIGVIGLLFTHNAIILPLIIFGISILIIRKLFNNIMLTTGGRTTYAIVGVSLIALLKYWSVAEIYGLQFSRVFRVFVPGDSLNQAAQSSEKIQGISLVDPLLHVALGLLVIGSFLLIFFTFHIFSYDKYTKLFSNDYYYSSCAVIAVFGSILFVALDTNIFRLVPLAPIFAAPIIGYVMFLTINRKPWGIIIGLAIILIIPIFITISATGPGYGPGVALTEDRPGLARNYLTDSDLSGVETTNDITAEFRTSNYVRSSYGYRMNPQGHTENISSFYIHQEKKILGCKNSVYFRNYYLTEFDFSFKQRINILLDVGKANLAECA